MRPHRSRAKSNNIRSLPAHREPVDNAPGMQETHAVATASAQEAAMLEREIQRLQCTRDLSREFVQSTGNMKKVMDAVFQRILEVLEAEAGSLWLFEARSDQNICHLAEGPARERILGLRIPAGEGIVGKVIAENTPDIVLDCSKDDRFNADIDKKSGFTTRSMICVPLADGDEAFGAIQIINKQSCISGQFTEDDRIIVQDLALSAAIAVRNARLLETESRVKEMNTLMKISRQVVSTLDLDMVLQTLVNTVNELVEITGAKVALVDEQKDAVFIAAISGGEKPNKKDPRQADLVPLLRQVQSSKQTSYVADIQKYREKYPDNPWTRYLEQYGIRAAFAAPLSDEEGVLGVLWLESDLPNFAPGNKSDMLYILAAQATVALRNSSLFQRIPLGQALGKLTGESTSRLTGWKRYAAMAGVALVVAGGLHFLPVFRSVSGEALVEARFGRGVYLPVGGRVTEVLVTEGDRVKQGDILARLDATPIQLRLVEAEARLAVLERQIVEARALSDTAAMSRAIIERNAARAEVAQARKDMENVTIRAPQAGLVLTARTQELVGREFPLGAEVLRIGDPEHFTVVVHVPEEDLLDVKAGQEVSGVLRSRPGEGFEGVVRHVGRAYAVPVEALEEGVAESSAPEGFIAEVTVTHSDVPLLPGMTGRASISTPESSALTRWGRRIINAFMFNFGH